MTPDDDLPEITDAMLERAELRVGERIIRRGRPPSLAPKQAIKLRLDPEVLAYFRAKGPGWQTRINETLRREAQESRAAPVPKKSVPVDMLPSGGKLKRGVKTVATKRGRKQAAKRAAKKRA